MWFLQSVSFCQSTAPSKRSRWSLGVSLLSWDDMSVDSRARPGKNNTLDLDIHKTSIKKQPNHASLQRRTTKTLGVDRNKDDDKFKIRWFRFNFNSCLNNNSTLGHDPVWLIFFNCVETGPESQCFEATGSASTSAWAKWGTKIYEVSSSWLLLFSGMVGGSCSLNCLKLCWIFEGFMLLLKWSPKKVSFS